MVAHQIFAQIYENEIKNIIVCDNYEMANWLSRATYGDSAFSVDCSRYACQIGDIYRDGVFYTSGGAEIVPLPDTEYDISVLRSQIEYLSMMSGIETEVNHE